MYDNIVTKHTYLMRRPILYNDSFIFTVKNRLSNLLCSLIKKSFMFKK